MENGYSELYRSDCRSFYRVSKPLLFNGKGGIMAVTDDYSPEPYFGAEISQPSEAVQAPQIDTGELDSLNPIDVSELPDDLAGTPTDHSAVDLPDDIGSPKASAGDVELGPPVDGLEPDEIPQGLLHFSYSLLTSMSFNIAMLIGLALWVLPGSNFLADHVVLDSSKPLPEKIEEDMVILDTNLTPSDDPLAFTPESDIEDLEEIADEAADSMDFAKTLFLDEMGTVSAIDTASFQPRPMSEMMKNIDANDTVGRHEVVNDYGQAFDHITREILRLIEERERLLVVWCFDQSESMKDDQQEIRRRIEKVYAELGVTDATSGDVLMTGITSFGENVAVHTADPTKDMEVIRKAIDEIPIDPSGEEKMCSAISQIITACQRYRDVQDRAMMLIMVTDESGNEQENLDGLEQTISTALAAECPIYFLGREAAFGRKQVDIRWWDEDNGREYILPIDRGPETAFIEQLQTEGYNTRKDVYSSGFGPYAQSRLAWQTGGIFFMLPSLEANIERSELIRYNSDVMKKYKPDLYSRQQIASDIKQSPLRSLITKIIYDLNPERKDVTRWMSLPTSFPSDLNQFASRLREAAKNAEFYYLGLQKAIQKLDEAEPLLATEKSLRWRANYDLIHAQCTAYAARVYLYGNALKAAAAKAEQTAQTLPDNRRLTRWVIQDTPDIPKDQTTIDLLVKAQNLYLTVIRNHRGTPWAARAEWELKRDFNFPGVELAFARNLEENPVPAGFDDPTLGSVAVAETTVGVGQGVGVGVGVGGGGGGGGGGGVGVGVGQGWGIDQYHSVALVPEYRKPPPPRKPSSGGHHRPSGQVHAAPKPSPPPKL